jgi:hypothetical protein
MKKALGTVVKWGLIVLLLWWVGKNPDTASSILKSAIHGATGLIEALTSALPSDKS